jgi:membrane peptidoglycan carboxypeptidase
LLATLPQQATQPLDHHADLIHLLEGVVRNGTGRHAALDGFAAGKTETSQGNRDAWFVGLTDQLVVGVWVAKSGDYELLFTVTAGDDIYFLTGALKIPAPSVSPVAQPGTAEIPSAALAQEVT